MKHITYIILASALLTGTLEVEDGDALAAVLLAAIFWKSILRILLVLLFL